MAKTSKILREAVPVSFIFFIFLVGAVSVGGSPTDKLVDREPTNALSSEKIAPEVKTLFNKSIDKETLPLVVFVNEPEGIKTVDNEMLNTPKIIDEEDDLTKVAHGVKEKEYAMKKGKLINTTELEKEKRDLENKEAELKNKKDAIRRCVIDNNKQKIKTHTDNIAKKLEEIEGVKVVFKGKLSPVIAIVIDTKNLEQAVKKIEKIPEVTSIVIDETDEGNLDVSIPTINANDIWYWSTGSDVKVAVEGTGISGNSNLNVWKAYSAVPGEGTNDLNGHGTKVAGPIASRHSTYKGASYDVSLMNAKCANSAGSGQYSWMVSATEWAINNGVNIIHRSRSVATIADDGTSSWSKYVDYIVDKYDVVWVNSIGNNQPSPRAPGGTYNVIGVGATDDKNTVSRSDDSVASFSPPGQTSDNRKKPDVVAPGKNIHTTTNSGGFVDASGTSFSAPHVTGEVALIKDDRPTADTLTIKAIIINSAEKRGFSSWNSNWGWGYIDAEEAWWDDYKTRSGTVGHKGSIYKYFNANAGETVTVTLTWKRHMTDASTVKGYSDLDIYVYSPGGSQVGYSIDANDNVEQVRFTASTTGKYKVKVYGYSVPSAIGNEYFVLAGTNPWV